MTVHQTFDQTHQARHADAVDHAPWNSRSEVTSMSRIGQKRISAARTAFSTRRVDFSLVEHLAAVGRPQSGDLVLARVESIGHHRNLETHAGRRSRLYVGDEIIVAYGARYAPDQFEGVVPDDLGPCDLAAGGGIAARVIARHSSARAPTRIVPLGLLADADGHVLNLDRFRLTDAPRAIRSPIVIAIVGTSMNAGKTTTAAALIHGLSRAGLKVGAAKATGTGSGGDIWSMVDAGADSVLDFTDMGHATTANVAHEEIERVATGLVDHLSGDGADIIVMEIADGLFQKETNALLRSPHFCARLSGIIFAAGDAMGAAHGAGWLREHGLPLLAISGLVSASPLGTRETEEATSLPVVNLDALSDPIFAPKLCLSNGGSIPRGYRSQA